MESKHFFRSECQSSEDLWICLVCGYVGCGRYVGGHSHAHFLETEHRYVHIENVFFLSSILYKDIFSQQKHQYF